MHRDAVPTSRMARMALLVATLLLCASVPLAQAQPASVTWDLEVFSPDGYNPGQINRIEPWPDQTPTYEVFKTTSPPPTPVPKTFPIVLDRSAWYQFKMTCPYVTSDGCGLLFHAYGHGSEAVSAGESVVKCAFVPGTTPACTTLFALNGATQEFAALGDGKPLYESPWYAKYSVQWNHK